MLPSLRKIDTNRILFVFSKTNGFICATAISVDLNGRELAKQVGQTFLTEEQFSALICKLESASISYIFDSSFEGQGVVSENTFATSNILFLCGAQKEKINLIQKDQSGQYVSPFVEPFFILATQQTRGPNC